MKFFSKDEYINTKLTMSSFKRIKEKRLKRALKRLSFFDNDVEVFNIDDDFVYVKDIMGNTYKFMIDLYSYDNSKKHKDLFQLEKRQGDIFTLYKYFDKLEEIGFGKYFEDGAVLTRYHSVGNHPVRYTIEKGEESYSFSTNYQGNISFMLDIYCSFNQGKENFESFLERCKEINGVYGGRAVVNYSNNDISIRSELFLESIKELELSSKVGSSTEVINLIYKDGKLTEHYEEIRELKADELSSDRKATVDSVKRLIKS